MCLIINVLMYIVIFISNNNFFLNIFNYIIFFLLNLNPTTMAISSLLQLLLSIPSFHIAKPHNLCYFIHKNIVTDTPYSHTSIA